MKVINLICLSIILCFPNSEGRSNEVMKFTLNILKEGEQTIEFGKYENILMVLGNTGAGKSTLAQLLAGDNDQLISKEIGDDTGEFVIQDIDNKISNNSTLVSQTIFPELVYDEASETAFYDCPGFSDTRNSSIEIASSYFINKILTSAKAIKSVFVVNYSSVKEGVDRTDFLRLLKHAATLFKDFVKYQKSISLIVTKVDNSVVLKDGAYVLVSDEKIIKNIGQFLENAKESLKDLLDKELKNNDLYNNALQLLDIFLMKTNDDYSRIGLFRRPNQPGQLSKIKLIQDGKVKIQKIIQDEIIYAVKDDTDFGFTMSDESINDIIDLAEEINDEINIQVGTIAVNFGNTLLSKEKESSDLTELKDYLLLGHDTMLKMIGGFAEILNPSLLIGTLKENLQNILHVQLEESDLSRITKYENFMKFLELVSSKQFNLKPNDWENSFKLTLNYLDESSRFYTFLNDLFVKLSHWSVQKDTNQFNVDGFKAEIDNMKGEEITGVSIKRFLEEIFVEEIKSGHEIPGFVSIENIKIDSTKINILIEMLDLAINFKVQYNCENDNIVIARGDFIKLNEVLNSKICPQPFQVIKIFGLYKIFLDQDFSRLVPDTKMILISPVWEIIGNVQINLNGDNAGPFSEESAANAETGANGAYGQPGQNGGPGGSFFGLSSHMISGQNLIVRSLGGNGANGQHGGSGGNGQNGIDGDWIISNIQFLNSQHIFSKTYTATAELNGSMGGVGGNGGHGGKGGFPGLAGDIDIYTFNENLEVQIQQSDGQAGADGQLGPNGIGGVSGRQCSANFQFHMVLKADPDVNKATEKWNTMNPKPQMECFKIKQPDGFDCNPGPNTEGQPSQYRISIDKNIEITTFREYLDVNIHNHIKKTHLKNFLNTLESNLNNIH